MRGKVAARPLPRSTPKRFLAMNRRFQPLSHPSDKGHYSVILGFVLGWCAATWWYSYLLSFYDTKPLPANGRRYVARDVRAEFARGWLRDSDGGP